MGGDEHPTYSYVIYRRNVNVCNQEIKLLKSKRIKVDTRPTTLQYITYKLPDKHLTWICIFLYVYNKISKGVYVPHFSYATYHYNEIFANVAYVKYNIIHTPNINYGSLVISVPDLGF